MADLIDRKEILRVIQNFDFHICCARATGKYRTSLEKYEMYRAIREQFLLLIKGIPKADTERHAHWIKNTVSSGQNSWTCSKCGRRARGKKENLPYCHCGCKMDEVTQ